MRTRLIRKFHLLISVALVFIIGCKYDDFVENEFDFTSVYFAKQEMTRTVVTDEWMEIGVGVMLGGKLKNEMQEETTIQLKDELIDPAANTRLPDNYFTLVGQDGNPTSKITIPAGSHQGFIYVQLNENFLNDKKALEHEYALGFEIIESSADSILAEKSETVVAFKYVNTYYGNYYREGETERYPNGGTAVDTTFSYDRNTDNNAAWELITVSRDTVNAAWSNPSGIIPDISLVVGESKEVKIIIRNVDPAGTQPGTILSFTDDGGSSYDPESRTFTLNYSYSFIDHQANIQKYKVKDKLAFRNRVIDGVNQWFE